MVDPTTSPGACCPSRRMGHPCLSTGVHESCSRMFPRGIPKRPRRTPLARPCWPVGSRCPRSRTRERKDGPFTLPTFIGRPVPGAVLALVFLLLYQTLLIRCVVLVVFIFSGWLQPKNVFCAHARGLKARTLFSKCPS